MSESEQKTNELQRAYGRALRTVRKEKLLRAARSAGFVADPKDPESNKRGKRKGYQVFVVLVKYSDEKLKANPDSGGLHAEP